jgi:hypothetical protein
MKHLTENELIELYYDEGVSAANAHLQECRECSAQYAELKQSLEEIQPPVAPQRSADYGERVWENLRQELIPYQKKTAGWHQWAQWKPAFLAIGCAMLLVAGFLGGRYWDRGATHKADVANNPHTAQRVVLVVLTDHLDRTERMLVELEHTDMSDPAENMALQSEARELLASNRLYRATASRAGDPALATALDRLEGVLAEIANDPNLTAADLEGVRKEMNTDGLLFEIRVLLARIPDQASGMKPANGAFI